MSSKPNPPPLETTTWDALVVGAGPAGAGAARGLAQQGARVLLVDKARFPRDKVCGGCLNGAALQALAELGLGGLPARLGARPLSALRLGAHGHAATLNLPAGAALSRARLDEALAAEALQAGADFQPETTAAWVAEDADRVQVDLQAPAGRRRVCARVVVAADGLTAGFTRHVAGVQAVVARGTRIGAGTTIACAPGNYPTGVIHMAVDDGGYVGLVRLEDDRLNVAAAFDVARVQSAGSLGAAARHILVQSGFPDLSDLAVARWRGTPPLTRRYILTRRTRRVVLIGDAASYIEPFTGEGMAWALASAVAVVPVVAAALRHDRFDLQQRWGARYRELLGWRQWRCRWLTRGLRSPALTSVGVRVLRAGPWLAAPYLRALNQVRFVPG